MQSLALVVFTPGTRAVNQPKESPINSLPIELVLLIADYLEAFEITQLAQTCRYWNLVCGQLWTHLLWRDYQMSPLAFRKPRPTARELYRSLCLCLRLVVL